MNKITFRSIVLVLVLVAVKLVNAGSPGGHAQTVNQPTIKHPAGAAQHSSKSANSDVAAANVVASAQISR